MDQCLPIKLLQDLKVWQPSRIKKHSVYPLQTRKEVGKRPKTLICHDMQGGYLDDRFVHGTKESNYYFKHWTMIDIFVYFSHHLVTIPPCGWITAAHRNGVKILGTFITEWDAGAEACECIMSDVPTVHKYCMQLVKIAEFYQFDGWLLNIENKINIKQIPLLEEFVRFLTLKMHEFQKGSLVIWYDSVTENGELKWQNELNQHNRNFFDISDGIFLNYNWTHESLQASLTLAEGRKSDIYVGVDVFGRGCLGGGGFSTNIAVMAAREKNLSVAIFAPGWVHETLNKEDFEENQSKFWNCLLEFCPSRRINSLPYYSSFCPGFGKNLFRNGESISPVPWFNLSLQQPQPVFETPLTNGAILSSDLEHGFNGGGCLKIVIRTPEINKWITVPILSTDFLMNRTCSFNYTFRSCSDNTEVSLILNVCDDIGGSPNTTSFISDYRFDSKYDSDSDEVFKDMCYRLDHLRTFCVTSYSSKKIATWTKRKYIIDVIGGGDCFIKEVQLDIKCTKREDNAHVLLGEFEISPCPNNILLHYKDLKTEQLNPGSLSLRTHLYWTSDINIDSSDLYICVKGKKDYICTTSQYFYDFHDFLHIDMKLNESFYIVFILYPKHSGKILRPVIVKVPYGLLMETVCSRRSAS